MKNDILLEAIKEVAEKYVKDNVKVKVYKTEPKDYFRQYTLQLDYNNIHTLYRLYSQRVKSEFYIMRVVSDLCIELAEMTQKERNYFFKRSDEQ